jgi:4'-phosphopantetheinyl transferase
MHNLLTGSVTVWLATLAECNLAKLGWLDERERQRYERFAADADRARFLLGASLVRAALGLAHGVRPDRVVLDRQCVDCGRGHGRPRITGSPIVASVAHSGALVVVATAPDGRVGIDVEQTGRGDHGEISRWVRQEAHRKAGGGQLAYRRFPTPVPGYLAGIAGSPKAGSLDHVDPRPGRELLGWAA